MIQSIGQSPANIYAAQVQSQNRPAGVPAGAKEAFAIDLDKLFTPSERKTMENIRGYSKEQGLSDVKIQELEASIITAKYSEQKAGRGISINNIIGQQIKGIKDGYGNNNGPSLAFLQNVYDNYKTLQGTELFA